MMVVRKALEQAGLDPAVYAGHSFRIGAVTTTAQRGVQDSLLINKTRGGGGYLPKSLG